MALGSYVANDNMVPCKIAKLDTSAGNLGKVLMAGSGDVPLGVVQAQGDQCPLNGLQNGYAAVAGENVGVWDQSDPPGNPYVTVDAAYPQGTLIKPGSGGIGTIASADGDYYIARLVQASLAANDTVECQIQFGMRGA